VAYALAFYKLYLLLLQRSLIEAFNLDISLHNRSSNAIFLFDLITAIQILEKSNAILMLCTCGSQKNIGTNNIAIEPVKIRNMLRRRKQLP
jgi:hypothetical protein